jgi:hypothetical protein
MMRAFFMACLLFLSLFICNAWYAFDCTKFDFGAKRSDIDDGNCILHKQADGVSYYNYAGDCRLPTWMSGFPRNTWSGSFSARLRHTPRPASPDNVKKGCRLPGERLAPEET